MDPCCPFLLVSCGLSSGVSLGSPTSVGASLWSPLVYLSLSYLLSVILLCWYLSGPTYCSEVHSISDLQLSRPTFASGALYFVTQLGLYLDSTVAECLLGLQHLPDSDCHLLHLPIYLLLPLP